MNKNKQVLILALSCAILSSVVGGCANKPPAQSPSSRFCRAPAIPQYSREFWSQLLAEDETLQSCCSASYKALEDWYVVRGKIAKCSGMN